MNCPRCGLSNPETAQRCDCGYDFINKSVEEPYFTSSPNTTLSRIAIGAQVVALVLAGGAVLWGLLDGPYRYLSKRLRGVRRLLRFICGTGRHSCGLGVTRGESCGEERAPGGAMDVHCSVCRGARPSVPNQSSVAKPIHTRPVDNYQKSQSIAVPEGMRAASEFGQRESGARAGPEVGRHVDRHFEVDGDAEFASGQGVDAYDLGEIL
jgi:hypothetical protein